VLVDGARRVHGYGHARQCVLGGGTEGGEEGELRY